MASHGYISLTGDSQIRCQFSRVFRLPPGKCCHRYLKHEWAILFGTFSTRHPQSSSNSTLYSLSSLKKPFYKQIKNKSAFSLLMGFRVCRLRYLATKNTECIFRGTLWQPSKDLFNKITNTVHKYSCSSVDVRNVPSEDGWKWLKRVAI
jgi:hypothetical protein